MADFPGFGDNRPMTQPGVSRRIVLGGLAAGIGFAATSGHAVAAPPIDAATEFGVTANAGDQTGALQRAIDAGRDHGRPILLPGGRIAIGEITIPGGTRIEGVPGSTSLVSDGPRAVRIAWANGVTIDGVGFEAAVTGDGLGILEIENASDIMLRQCRFTGGPANGIAVYAASATIEGCSFEGHPNAAIHSMEGTGLMIRGNWIRKCGNAGIQIWRSAAGRDGSIITGNRIETIDWVGGGNGQNGNGVNVYLADEVIVADNHIADCAFTAVRLNTTRNSQVRGNVCINSGEVAIFSEFGFSGSVIADNTIDGAATGIDITNLDTGGRVATCTGNVVRNIYPGSQVNPDTRPVGIYAEADTVVTGNIVENVPGIGIVAGWGPFLRNLVVSANVVTAADIGIAVSVVREAGVGPVAVTGNVTSQSRRHGIAGMEWENVVSADLVRDAAHYPHVALSGNVAG